MQCLIGSTCNDLRKLRKHVRYIRRLCPGIVSKRGMNDFFTLCTRDENQQFAPCTTENGSVCDIVHKFSFFNGFLQTVRLELKEVEPGIVGIVRLQPHTEHNFYEPWAWIVMHWLLKEHRCITTLMLSWPMTLSMRPNYLPGLLLDALRLSTKIKTLRLWGSIDRLWSYKLFKEVTNAIGTLRRLETVELYFHVVTAQETNEYLGMALGRLSALTCLTLTLSTVKFVRSDAELLLLALKSSPTISALDIDDYFLLVQGGKALADLVAHSTTLRRLCLSQVVCRAIEELEILFIGLSFNHHLQELSLKGFALEWTTMDTLAQVVARHRALRCLEVLSYVEISGVPLAGLVQKNTGLRKLLFVGGKSVCLAFFARAIRMNTTLESLFLGLSNVKASDYEGFLKALASNKSLQRVTFERVRSEVLSDLCTLLHNTGTEGRVRFPAEFVEPQVLEKSIANCKKLRHLSYSPWEGNCDLPSSALRQLIHYDQLQELSIRLRSTMVCKSAACLAPFLASTNTLRDAHLEFRVDVGTTRLLLDAISHNKSISRLTIKDWTFGTPEGELLFDIIMANVVLNELHIELQPTCRRHLRWDLLRERLLPNHCLLKVRVPGTYYFTSESGFPVQEVMLRNLSTLHRAVQFVMGSRGRVYAEAIERVSKSLALLKAVESAAGVSEEQARQRVKDARRFLDEHFFVAVGVVKEALVCSRDGRLHLDQIGLDNWLHIRRYLKVSDIKPR